MTERLQDPEVRALAAISATLQVGYEVDDLMWEGSPSGWMKRRPSRQVGAIGEKLVAGWLAAKDFDVARSPDSEADRLINGHRIEVKFSTLWATGYTSSSSSEIRTTSSPSAWASARSRPIVGLYLSPRSWIGGKGAMGSQPSTAEPRGRTPLGSASFPMTQHLAL